MSRSRSRGRRRPEPCTTITLVEGEGKGVALTIIGMTDGDVAEARRQAAAGNIAHALVVRIVATFIRSLGIDVDDHDWTGPPYIALLEMLGMPPFQWSDAEDVELAQLLAEAGGGRG